MATYTQALRELGEQGLATLLELRPDLGTPPPSSLRALAARATTRVSLERALVELDALALQVIDAALALHRPATATVPGRAADLTRLLHAVTGAPGDAPATPPPPVDAVREAVSRATARALLWTADDDPGLRPAPGLMEVLGPHPAGLGPWLTTTLARRSEDGLARLRTDLDLPADADLTAVADHLGRPATVSALLDAGPAGVRQVLTALAWGPPVGRSPETGTATSPARVAVDWLLRHGLLALQDAQHVVLPRDVALALREGRTHRGASTAPTPVGREVPAATVRAESAHQAEEAVRLVGALVELWGTDPAPTLRSGGLGTRELRRITARLGVDEPTAALLVEVAAAAGLVAEDGEDPALLAPTSDGEGWARAPLAERWAELAEAWLAAERAAWLVGTRDDKGSRRAALDPEARRPWAPRLRTSTLGVLADAGAALSGHEVHEVLVWLGPRSAPPEHAVEAVLREAATLGVLGAGALAPAGAALLSAADDPASALEAQLPTTVDEVLLQGDLTGIVPGRPSPALSALLEVAAEVESRGAALTVRFTPASVRRALDAGRDAEHLLADLSRHARSGVPQPLEYLVLDAARRHGQVRVGLASSYLRTEDAGLLAGLVEDRALATLGLVRLAPTVIAAQVPPATLVAALRERGLSPVTEDATGAVVTIGPRRHVVRSAGRGRPSPPPSTTEAEQARARRLARLATDLLTRDRADLATAQDPTSGPPPAEGTPDPVTALAMLREAATEGREVWLEVVGTAGSTERRRVRPVRVDAGRVRVVDADREAEITVAVHRIAGVAPA